jgi:hypothetical protein
MSESTEMWNDPPDEDFNLPGDEEIISGLKEAVAEKEETPAPEAAPAEEAPSEEAAATEEQPRGPDGKFLPKEEPEPPDPEDATEGGEAEAEKLLAGRFKTVEDLEQGYEEARAKLGEQGSELGDLRKAFEQRLDEFEERVKPPAPSYDLQQVQERLDENPSLIPQLAAAAWQEGNDDILAAALVAWREHDPMAAQRFQLDISRAEAREAAEELAQGQSALKSSWERSAEAFAQKHPDFPDHAPQMKEIAAEYPNMLKILEQGDSSAQTEVLSFLYREARDRASENLTSQAREAKAATAAETAQAIEEAAVTSGASAHVTEKKSGAERVGEQWEEMDRPLNEGWKV